MQKRPEQERLITKKKVVVLALELGYIIALPIVILGLAGKYLDERTGADPVFKIIGLLLAIAVSTIWLYRKFSEIFQAMTRSKDSEDPKDHQS